MLRTLPSSSSTQTGRRGAQPGNSNALKHGFYSSHTSSPVQPDARLLKQLSVSYQSFTQASSIALLEQHLRDTSELLIDHFLATCDTRLQPDTIGKLERFFRTVSYELRLKRTLKKWRDERDFLPNLAKNALPLAVLEFTDPRISVFALYGANQALNVGAGLSAIASPLGTKWYAPARLAPARPPSPISGHSPDYSGSRECTIVNRQSEIVNRFVPQFFTKNHTITNHESIDFSAFSPAFSAETTDSPPRSANLAPVVPQTPPEIIADSSLSTDDSRAWPNTDLCPPIPDNPPSITDSCLLNTDYFFPPIPSQQALLDPVLHSLRSQLDSMAIRIRQPSHSDLCLLQIILLRLAFNLRWTDLPPSLPLRLCQAYYKYLCTSGCMQQIYRLLHEDLSVNGRKNLLEMVDSGHFQVQNGRIYLTADKPITWESFTGLLLLQRACLNQRRLKRAISKERSPNRYQIKPPSSPRSPRQPSLKPPRPSGLIPVLDCRSTNPILYSKLRHPPGDPSSGSP